MGNVWATGQRVFVEDARGGDAYLRATWHPEGRQFVISHWQGNVCLAATRVPVEAAPQLIGLLAGALGDVVSPTVAEPTAAPTDRGVLQRWWERSRSWLLSRAAG
ncbi:hypothetical protein [Actinomarinicola tropica]|uniref:DUF317 domain-containing protein n=1 Tax=Actinomarinicola tropica TaxID=2789776 RepID=A0A5Q2RGU0_9ACTN|nr:hypothetical protein [Actinomarinicola tropica]QGG94953.1 hypothetical protein GH723_07425 [Actinomarinicola tropica]